MTDESPKKETKSKAWTHYYWAGAFTTLVIVSGLVVTLWIAYLWHLSDKK